MKGKTFSQLKKVYEDVIEELEINRICLKDTKSKLAKECYTPSFLKKVNKFRNQRYIRVCESVRK